MAPLTRSQVLALREQLLAFRERVEGGELDATVSTRYRIDGAIVALSTVLGDSPGDVTELLSRSD
jgi:hypothetical protein